MLRLAVPLVALALLAAPARAQDSTSAAPDRGFSVSFGLPAVEALAATTKEDVWSARYRFANGVALGVFGTGTEYDRFDRTGVPDDGELARRTDGVRRQLGVTAERIVRTRLADVRVGALANYGYSRTTRQGFTLQPGGFPPYTYPFPPDSVETLQPESSLYSQDRLRTMSFAASVTASRALRLSKAGRLDPGIGLAFGAAHITEAVGPRPPETASAVAFIRLPARLAITPSVGVTLDTTIGAEIARRSDVLVQYTGRRWNWYPSSGASVRVDF